MSDSGFIFDLVFVGGLALVGTTAWLVRRWKRPEDPWAKFGGKR